MRILLLSALVLILSAPAFAQSTVVHCGEPVSTNLETVPKNNYCDIHARRLGYGEERQKLKNRLEERRKNFHAPQKESRDTYMKNVEALWKSGNVGNQ